MHAYMGRRNSTSNRATKRKSLHQTRSCHMEVTRLVARRRGHAQTLGVWTGAIGNRCVETLVTVGGRHSREGEAPAEPLSSDDAKSQLRLGGSLALPGLFVGLCHEKSPWVATHGLRLMSGSSSHYAPYFSSRPAWARARSMRCLASKRPRPPRRHWVSPNAVDPS